MSRLLLSSALSFLLLSCAAEVPGRSTVQVDAIAKSDLAGTWYFRQTVVGAPYTTGFTFIGEQGENEMEKITWDIQEGVLTARRAYEHVRGTEKGEPSHASDPNGYQGAPVAAFRIRSHFDIARDYNVSTGEEFNRIVENQERKWFDRQFIRVDWSENLITDFRFLVDYNRTTVSNIAQDPAPYYVSDPESPDALRLERPSATEAANYLEITQKIIASPEAVDFYDSFNVPICWLEYSTSDCASQEIKLRNSFMRADDRDYEPMRYDDKMMERFGYFTTQRLTYNRQYGETERGRVRLINRFNIWRKSLTADRCKQDADCGAAAPGRSCNVDLPDTVVETDGTLSGRCTLPYAVRNLEDVSNPQSADRGPRKIVYFLNDTFPKDLMQTAVETVRQYDQTFRDTYATVTGRQSPSNILTLCANNPVVEGDPAECGPVGTHARLGDLRYSMIHWVDEPTAVQLLGYGPSNHDPETGETIQAYAFIYGAAIDTYSTEARDIVRLVNNEIPIDSFLRGSNVKNWVETNPGGSRSKSYSAAEQQGLGAGMDLSFAAGLPKTPVRRKGNTRALMEMKRERQRAFAGSSLLGADPGLTSRRLAMLKGTDLERQLLNGEVLLANGVDPRLSPSSVDLAKVSPLSSVNPERVRALQRERNRLGARGLDLMTSFDDSVLGFAVAQKGKNPQDVWRAVRSAVTRSTTEHELGHSLGLRHNFAGSFDAMNYPKTYWDLRLADGTSAPRYVDPETVAEQRGVTLPSGLTAGISEFQTSSVMDYAANFNSDIQGLGRYDRAAIKFGYGQVVEVFNQTQNAYLMGALQVLAAYGDGLPIMGSCNGANWISVHYSKLPTIVNLESRTDALMSTVTKSILRPDCAYPDEVEHDPARRIVVPYRFCSDEFEAASPGCSAYDRGADVHEIATHAMTTYRNYYLFNNFKRDRVGFNPEGYLDRIYGRYLDPLRSQMQFYSLTRADFFNDIPDDGSPTNFWRSPDAWGAYTAAVTEGFDFFGDIVTTPEPGPYYQYTLNDGRDAYQPDPNSVDPAAFLIKIPDGRFFETQWDYDSGYYWYERVDHIGIYLDKVAALAQLTDPETSFLGKDAASDVRQYAINYHRLFPKQMEHVFAGLLTDRWDRFGSIYDGTKVVKRPISKPITLPPSGSLPIDPRIGFSVQLYAGTLGMALIPGTFDQSFADSSRVFLQGNGQAIDASLPKVTYTDPFSGKIYVAVSYLNGVIEEGVGARMIARANELRALYTAAPSDPAARMTLKSYVQVLELMRTLSSTYADTVR